jgi:hypothetical protein
MICDGLQRLLGGLDRDAEAGDGFLRAQLGERVEDRVHVVDRRRRAVQLDQVQGVHLQVGAAALDPGTQVHVGVGVGDEGIGATADLGGDHDAVGGVTQLGAETGDQLLAAAVPVDVGGVEERHARLVRGTQHREGVVLGHVAPVGAELPAAQPHDRRAVVVRAGEVQPVEGALFQS